MKEDIIILRPHCPDCDLIRTRMPVDVVTEDNFTGKHGQCIHVVSGLSEQSSRFLVSQFAGIDTSPPVVVTCDGAAITSVENILTYLKKQQIIIQ